MNPIATQLFDAIDRELAELQALPADAFVVLVGTNALRIGNDGTIGLCGGRVFSASHDAARGVAVRFALGLRMQGGDDTAVDFCPAVQAVEIVQAWRVQMAELLAKVN